VVRPHRPRLLQERAAIAQNRRRRVSLRCAVSSLRATDAVGYLRAFWTLHNIGALDRAGLEAALKLPADVVRAWAFQLATDRPQKAAARVPRRSPSRRERSLTVRQSCARVGDSGLAGRLRWTVRRRPRRAARRFRAIVISPG
jgi:hypothetical protein